MGIFDGIFGKKEKAKSEADAIKLELRALLQDLPVIQKENISDYRQRIMGPRHILPSLRVGKTSYVLETLCVKTIRS